MVKEVEAFSAASEISQSSLLGLAIRKYILMYIEINRSRL